MAPAPVIRLHPDDGVLIARSSIPAGTLVADGVTTVATGVATGVATAVATATAGAAVAATAVATVVAAARRAGRAPACRATTTSATSSG